MDQRTAFITDHRQARNRVRHHAESHDSTSTRAAMGPIARIWAWVAGAARSRTVVDAKAGPAAR